MLQKPGRYKLLKIVSNKLLPEVSFQNLEQQNKWSSRTSFKK